MASVRPAGAISLLLTGQEEGRAGEGDWTMGMGLTPDREPGHVR